MTSHQPRLNLHTCTGVKFWFRSDVIK